MRLALSLVFTCVVVGVFCEERYTDKYNNVNIDNILKNDRLLKNYVNCLLDKGKCTNDAAELKRIIPDALATDCVKCSERQRNGIRKIVKFLAVHKRELWNELAAKYDPDGVYRKKYADLGKEEGIEL